MSNTPEPLGKLRTHFQPLPRRKPLVRLPLSAHKSWEGRPQSSPWLRGAQETAATWTRAGADSPRTGQGAPSQAGPQSLGLAARLPAAGRGSRGPQWLLVSGCAAADRLCPPVLCRAGRGCWCGPGVPVLLREDSWKPNRLNYRMEGRELRRTCRGRPRCHFESFCLPVK